MDTPNDQVGMRARLRELVTIDGIDPTLLRLDVRVEPDGKGPNPGECDEAARDAWHRWEWWYVHCQVTVVMTDATAERWLELGRAGVDRLVEGKQPGRPFISVWEDCLQLWEGLAREAVADAGRTLAALQGVKVAWMNTAIDQPVSGSLPGC